MDCSMDDDDEYPKLGVITAAESVTPCAPKPSSHKKPDPPGINSPAILVGPISHMSE